MLAIFETHPVQYRAPVYKELQSLVPSGFHVFYATDVSVRGNHDAEFGRIVAWDEPLLEGYPNTILKLERGEPLKGFWSLHGKGLSAVFSKYRPKAVLQTQFLYEYDFGVMLQAALRRIPIWMRQETQDFAFQRSFSKSIVRSAAYRLIYSFVKKAFYVGHLNREHLVRHGISPQSLVRAPYTTPDRFESVTEPKFLQIREECRAKFGISKDRIVFGFFGKLIPKKNPDLLLQAVQFLRNDLKSRVTLLFVGSGALEAEMKERARQIEESGVQCVFAGFINQAAIRDFYAATDVVVLPSRRAGETWGLVINEALQAGCGVVMSDAVGCKTEFGGWERVRIIPVGDAPAMARAWEDLAAFSRKLDWARDKIKAYSSQEVAHTLADQIRPLLN